MSIPNSPREIYSRILIFGGRSWIGFHVAQQFAQAGAEVICTTSSGLPDDGATAGLDVRYVQCSGARAGADLVKLLAPDIVINLLIGISDDEFATHAAIARQTESAGTYYIYASSALALDGYEAGRQLTEDLPAKAVSDYGQFKQRCEEELNRRDGLSALILRFASIHGWSPWKDTRTVALLKKVANNERIEVSRGVLQNRCTDVHLAETVFALACEKFTGVAHIGASDSSEEYVFLKKLAKTFGYTQNNIVEVGEREVNLVVIPASGIHPGGAISERDTLRQLTEMPELKQYHAGM